MPSNGKGIQSKRSYRRYEKKLALAQRRLSPKKKFSKNWHKEKGKVAKIHTKIAQVRKDFLHWTSTKLSNNHAIICVEDLKVSNMSKSAKGTIEASR
jgi:putative transposase